jgi:hypothetical protein
MLFTLRAYDYPHQQTVVSRSLAHHCRRAFLYDGATPSMRTWWFYDDGLSAPVENPSPWARPPIPPPTIKPRSIAAIATILIRFVPHSSTRPGGAGALCCGNSFARNAELST